MCPTSIAVWNPSRPPQIGHASPSTGRRMSANRAVKSRPCSTPRRCQPVRFAPATNWPSRSASSATISPVKPTGPSEPGSAPNAARISSSVAGRNGAAERRRELCLLEPVVAADEGEHDRAVVLRHGHRLRRRGRVDPEEARELVDRRDAGRRDLGRRSSGSGNVGRARNAARDLEVGGVVAVLTGDERVLACARRRQVVDRLAAAHHPRLGLHRDGLDPAALEDPVVRALVLLEAHLEAGLVAVERVGVLHDELPHPQQPTPGTRLVTALRLEVVERLRQVAVRAELREVKRHRLLVRHREDEVAAAAVLQPEELGDPDSGRSSATARRARAPA